MTAYKHDNDDLFDCYCSRLIVYVYVCYITDGERVIMRCDQIAATRQQIDETQQQQQQLHRCEHAHMMSYICLWRLSCVTS